MKEFYIWQSRSEPGACGLTTLKGLDSQIPIDLQRGRKVDPADVADGYFEMNPAHPRDVDLVDQLCNISGMNVIGPKFAAFLQAQEIKGLELLSVEIRDHKGRVASNEYCVVHTTQIVDCIDQDASVGLKWNRVRTDMIRAFKEIVLKTDLDEGLPALIRPRHLEHRIFVSKDLADAISGAGFSGYWVAPMNKFDA